MRAVLLSPGERWQLFIDKEGRECIVCIVDDNPETVIAATALGVHAVVVNPPAYFSWHLVIRDTRNEPDIRSALAYRLKEWKDKHPWK